MTSQFDMGNMDQVLWHSLHGQWFMMADPIAGALESRAAIHTDFLLLAYMPFYALWPDPRTPLLLQVLAVASGVIPLWWLARKKLSPRLSAMVAVTYLAFPALEWSIIFDVHAVVLVTPLFLWAWWAASEKRWWLYGLTVGLALLGKEEVGLVVAAMGVYWLWRRGYRTMGIASVVAGLSWTIAMVEWVIPHARQLPGHFALNYFSDYGSSYEAIIKGIIQHPLKVLGDVFGKTQLELMLMMLAPVGFVALLGWPILLVALPDLGINLLSNNANQHTIFFQYMAVTTPFIFLAAIDGLTKVVRWHDRGRKTLSGYRRRTAILGLAAGVAVATVWWLSPLPFFHHGGDALTPFKASPYLQDVKTVQRQLLATDKVAVTNNLGPQFSRREYIWAFPNSLDRADAVIVLTGGAYDVLPKEQIIAKVAQLANDSRFTLVLHDQDFWYFRRVAK